MWRRLRTSTVAPSPMASAPAPTTAVITEAFAPVRANSPVASTVGAALGPVVPLGVPVTVVPSVGLGLGVVLEIGVVLGAGVAVGLGSDLGLGVALGTVTKGGLVAGVVGVVTGVVGGSVGGAVLSGRQAGTSPYSSSSL